MKLLFSILLFSLGQILIFFQLNGQFLWDSFKENKFLLSLIGIPVSFCFIYATKFAVEYFGLMWPARFIGFGSSIIIYIVFVYIYFNEGITIKTAVSLLLSLLLICIQLFWKTN